MGVWVYCMKFTHHWKLYKRNIHDIFGFAVYDFFDVLFDKIFIFIKRNRWKKYKISISHLKFTAENESAA